ncbi:amidohydrolase family protein [Kitasatospora sp. NPDC002551]|uniref:N-acetylglucosamine-6-phosphate deacetylase n=1 Tax=unclassified Kitasatospora TaxID=2633591 RepID=UPI00331EF603
MSHEQRLALVNATVVHPHRLGAGECLLLRDGTVEYAGPARRPPAGYRSVDLDGDYVLPGLIDVHVHGALGRTFNEPDPDAWRTVLDAHAAAGTTGLLATLATDRPPALRAALRAGRRLPAGSGLLGTHLEGPYLDPRFGGAHPPDALRTPAQLPWPWLLAEADFVRMVTLAPELPGSAALIGALTDRGVVVSAGHSGATGRELTAARTAGLRHVAHLWSGQSTLAKDGPWRVTGLLETVLASEGLTAELIADGRHLPAELVRIAHRCLGPDRLCLVSDASAGTGLAPGSGFAMGAVRGVVADGVALGHDGASFCGSTSHLADVLRFTVQQAHVPLVEAVRMAATTPARVLGLADRTGALVPGLAADVVVLDRDLRVRRVARAGRWLRDRAPEPHRPKEVPSHG